MARIFALMGSGENSPAMVTPHQNILKKIGKNSKRINLDTPYGFQENADELTARILGYFEKNVGSPIEDIKLRNLKDDYNRISQRAIEQKKEDALEKWFNTKIKDYYIMIDEEYKSCPTLKKWVEIADAITK